MNSKTDVRGALHDLFQLKFGSYSWVPRLFAAITLGALVLLLSGILFGGIPGPGYVPPAFRRGLAYRAVFCWTLSTFCAYAGGFIMGRLYVPRA
jgi:hypothetical protein